MTIYSGSENLLWTLSNHDGFHTLLVLPHVIVVFVFQLDYESPRWDIRLTELLKHHFGVLELY